MSARINTNYIHRSVESQIAAPPTPVVTSAWVTPDVHHWSVEMQEILQKEFARLPELTLEFEERFDEAAAEIRAMFPDVAHVLDKMSRRRACVDHDLHGVKPTGMLALTWFDYVKKIGEGECYALFHNTMVDMGSTCVQGDTHRLFTIIVALARDALQAAK